MRVITGTARGRRLLTLEGQDVRPTAERVKEAVFSILQFQIEGRRFLDLFAGSGQIGIEALSRGAAQAVFVDARRESGEIIKKNLNAVDLEKNARVLTMEARSFLMQNNDPFDIAFLDPPYQAGLLEEVLPRVAGLMNKGGTIVCEHPTDLELPAECGDFLIDREYRYGKIRITVFRHKEVMEQ